MGCHRERPRCRSMARGPQAFPLTCEGEQGRRLPVMVAASWFCVSLLLASGHAFPHGPPSKQCPFLPGPGPDALEPGLALPLATSWPQLLRTPAMLHPDTGRSPHSIHAAPRHGPRLSSANPSLWQHPPHPPSIPARPPSHHRPPRKPEGHHRPEKSHTHGISCVTSGSLRPPQSSSNKPLEISGPNSRSRSLHPAQGSFH